MTNLVFIDNNYKSHLLPLTFLRPMADIRVGILTIREKWERLLSGKASFITQDYLSRKFPAVIERDNLFIAGNVLPDEELVQKIKSLVPNEGLFYQQKLIAARISGLEYHKTKEISTHRLKHIDLHQVNRLTRPADIFVNNGEQIKADYKLLTGGRKSQPLPTTTQFIGHQVFIEEGASILAASINSTNGPIYIGKGASIMEGVMLRGPLAIGDHATVKMGAKIYGDTTIGPWSKVGGEISNSVFFGYSNKGHDGYLGNSVIGEWCNFGADTNISNLKNTYSTIKVWHYPESKWTDTGLQFHGLIMGDHSKTGINSMLNTGSVIGINAQLLGGHIPPKFVPSFSWDDGTHLSEYDMAKAIQTAKKVMERRSVPFTELDKSLFEHIFRMTAEHRKKHHLHEYP